MAVSCTKLYNRELGGAFIFTLKYFLFSLSLNYEARYLNPKKRVSIDIPYNQPLKLNFICF